MPCEIGELQDDQKNTIVANYTDLIEDIKHDPVGLARSLFQKRVFEDNDIEKIKREERCVTGSKTNAAAKLLDILLNSGDAAYGKFIEALKENGYFKTVRVLTSDKEVKEVHELKDGNPGDRFGERGVVTEKLHIKVEKGRPPEDMNKKIRKNYVYLTDEIKNDYKYVMSSLFNYKAISEDDMEQIKREETSQGGGKKAATREMLDILLNRGETGYKKFLEALYANKCFNAVFRLEPGFGGDGSIQPGTATDMEEGGTSNSPGFQSTDETFQVNLIEHNLSEDTDTESERDVVICVVDDVAHFNDTEKQGLAFKHGLEGYVLSIRTDISDTDSVCFKLSQDDGDYELVSDYKIILDYGSGNMIIYHVPNMVIDNLQPGPTVVHIDTGATYKCRAGVVRSHDDEDVIVHTNIQTLPEATTCKIIFGDNFEVRCCKIRTHPNMEYSSLIVKSAEIPNSVNLLTLDQWMKQLNIPQLCDDQDNHSYQYSDKYSGEQFWTNLINNGNDDDIDSFSNNKLIDIKTNVPNFEINDREGLAFKSGSHAYVSAKAKIHDIDNVCFKLCNADGSDELITDHKIVLNCGWRNMDIYYIPNLIIGNLKTGPTIVHIDTGKVYKYRAGVVQSQDDEHIIVHSNINHLPDVSKCKIIFDDTSMVSCCGITKHQQCSSLLMKMVEIPSSINLMTVDQWMKQFNITQEEDGNKYIPGYQRINSTTDETFQVNLVDNKLSEDTDVMAEKGVVISVVDDVSHFNDTEKQGLAFKHRLEGYVLCIRTDIRDTDSVQFKLSQDDGSAELLRDDQEDNHSYQYSDKFSGENFWINLVNNGNDDDIDSFCNNMTIDIKMNVSDFDGKNREGVAFQSGAHGYVSAKAKIHDIDNVCFKLCNDDGSDELITDHKIILNCGWRNMVIYYIPNLIIDNLQTGPTVVHIDTGEIYIYRAGVVQSQVDEHYIVHTNINHLPDVSKCKIIFDDTSIASCCGITKHQQCSSLLMMKMVEIPASINVVTVEQWMQQLHRKQVPLRMDDQEQSAVVQDTASIKSKERGPMTGEDLKRMGEAKLKLIDGISDPQPICDYLVDEGILLPEDIDAIDMVDLPIKKTIRLLNLLIKEYKGSFSVFVRALKETHHYSLAKLLEDGLEGENFVETIGEDINQSELVTAQNMATYKPLGAKPADQNKEVKEVHELKDGNPEDRFGESGVVTEKLHIKVEKGRPEDMYNKIRSNYNFLTDEIKNDYKDVMSSLFNYKAISEDDVEQIKRGETSQGGGKTSATRELLDILLNRGEKGYKKFLEALYANKCFNALFRLEPGFGGDGSTEPGIATDKLLIESLGSLHRSAPSFFNDFLKDHKDLFGKKNVDSSRLRTMKDNALTNLQDVNEKDYVKTRALIQGLEILKSHHILGIIGAAGDGKTTLSMMIASQFIEEHPEYQPLLINDLDDLNEVNLEDDKYLYVIDDMYGKVNKLPARIDKWPNHLSSLRINKERGKLVIIYIMRDYIYRSYKYQLDKYDLFEDNIEKTTQIFLHKSKFSLNDEEKGRILDFYGVTSDKIIDKIFNCFGFPAIVSLCGKLMNDKLPEDLISSHDFLLSELETFWEENEYIYATLLLVFCLNTVSEKDLEPKFSERIEPVISTISKVVCKEFELKGAKFKLDELSDTFIKYIEENYMKIFSLRDFVEAPFLHHLSAKWMDFALQYCSFELLMALIRTNGQEERCILVRDKNYDDLLIRFIKELRDKNADIVSHPAFIDYKFLSRFLRMDGIANLLHDIQFINLRDIRDIQESGNFLHYITLHGDMRCLKAALSYFHNQLPQLVEKKTDMGWDIISLAAVSMHDPIEKMNLLKEKKIGDCYALPHLAVYSDKFDTVEYISNFTNFDKNKQDTKSRTVLHNACDSKHDNSQIINFLIGKAFDVNARDESGSTPLHLAVTRGKPQTVSILISKGAEVNVKDNMGRLPIHNISSLFGGRTDVLNQLIQAGSLLYEADKLGRIPLLEVIANVDRECFELLINRLSYVDTLNEHIHSILLESTQLMNDSMFRSILNTVKEIHFNHLVGNVLFKCCSSVDKMRILYNKGVDFNVVDDNSRSVLHHSCRFGSIDTVRYLVNEIGLNITQKDNAGVTPIFHSVISDIDPVKKIKFFLSKGCNLHVVDDKNRGLLHFSCSFGSLQTVEYLVNQVGLDVSHKDNYGLTPARFCPMSNINPISKLELLSSQGVNLHAVDNNNASLLHVSCQNGTVETVEYLVNKIGLDVNHIDNNGWTPAIYCSMSNINPISKLELLSSQGVNLHAVNNKNGCLLNASCEEGTPETVEYLVNEIGLDVNHKDNNGWTAAMFCSVSNKNPISKLKLLSSKGVRLHALYNKNQSLLHISCHMGTVETVEYLVNEIGLDVHHKNNNGLTPAMHCSMSDINPIRKLELLSSKGASLHALDNMNRSLLHASCHEGTVETVEYLVNESGLDVHHKDNNGWTPAMFCSASNINPIRKLELLSSKGASLRAVDNKNRSLLHDSCAQGTVETVEYLVKEIGLDVNHKDNNGWTPAVSCSVSNINPISKLELLSSQGLSLHAVDWKNRSLLHVSCALGTVETVEYLVNDIGLDLNHIDNNGWTAAMFCSVFNINPISKLELLASQGVSLHAVDNKNRSLLHVSCALGTVETVEYLVNDIGLDVNHKDNNGWTAAMFCSVSNINPISKLELLASQGVSLHAVDNKNRGLLHVSCDQGTVETVEYLVNEIGQDVHHIDNNGLTPAMYSSMSNINPISKLKLLSLKGVSLHAVHNNNRSLLLASCQGGTVETVEYLVNEIGLDVHHKNNNGLTPAMHCSMSDINPIRKLELLSSKGVSLHAVDSKNMSLLHSSCEVGTVETVEYLVNEIRLDVNHKDNNGWTPAMFCSVSNINPISKLELLSSKGVSLHVVDNKNRSLLHTSCHMGTVETVEYLVNEIGLDVNHEADLGTTPAFFCCKSYMDPVKKVKFLSSKGTSFIDMELLLVSCLVGAIETVEYLVKEIGLDVNQSHDNFTPLLCCFNTEIQKMEKINFLISNGARIIICRPYKDFFRDEDDYCKCSYPLHHSCYLGTLDTVRVLVNDAGYDVNYTDGEKMAALLWCFKTGIQQQEKIRFLIFKGAVITIFRPYKDFFSNIL